MESLGLAGIVSHDKAKTSKYNKLLQHIGSEGMLIQFERFMDERDLDEIIRQTEDNLLENNIELPY
jgi:hypothetical protein